MPYGKCIILEEETKELGTSLELCNSKSRNKIAIKCIDCQVKIIREFKGFKGRHICKTIINGLKKCFKCGIKKEVDNFAKNRASHDGYSKLCKNCYSNYGSVKRHYKNKCEKIKSDIRVYFKHKYRGIKSKCIRLEIPFALEEDDLYELYLKQDKKCFYTGIEIVHNINYVDYNSISVDKKDPLKGYTKDNIVLCAFCINSFKGNKTEVEFKMLILETHQKLLQFASTIKKE